MKSEQYEAPVMEIVEFENEDIITASTMLSNLLYEEGEVWLN